MMFGGKVPFLLVIFTLVFTSDRMSLVVSKALETVFSSSHKKAID